MDHGKRHFLQLLGAGAMLAVTGASSVMTGASNAVAGMVTKLKLSDAEWRFCGPGKACRDDVPSLH